MYVRQLCPLLWCLLYWCFCGTCCQCYAWTVMKSHLGVSVCCRWHPFPPHVLILGCNKHHHLHLWTHTGSSCVSGTASGSGSDRTRNLKCSQPFHCLIPQIWSSKAMTKATPTSLGKVMFSTMWKNATLCMNWLIGDALAIVVFMQTEVHVKNQLTTYRHRTMQFRSQHALSSMTSGHDKL